MQTTVIEKNDQTVYDDELTLTNAGTFYIFLLLLLYIQFILIIKCLVK